MRAGEWVTRGLLVLALVAAGVWVSRERGKPAVPDPRVSLGAGPDFGPIARLVAVAGGESLVVVGEPGAYHIVHPVQDLANDEEMAEILRAVRGLKAERVVEGGAPSLYHLDPPLLSLEVRAMNGAVWRVDLGDSAAVSADRYARVHRGTAQVAMIDGWTARRHLSPRLDRMRFAIALPLAPGGADSVLVWTREHRLAARRLAPDAWIAREPRGLRIEGYRITRVLGLFSRPNLSMVTELRGFDLKRVGLDPPRATWITYQAGRADTLRVGNPTADQKWVLVRPARRRVVGLIPSDFYRDVVDGWPRLADLRLLTLAPDSVISIQWLGSGARCARDAGIWKLHRAGGEGTELPDFATEATNLAALRWKRYPVTPPALPDGPRIRLRLETPARAETLELTLPTDTLAYARAGRRGVWGEVSDRVYPRWESFGRR